MCRFSEVVVIESVDGGDKVLSHPVHKKTSFKIQGNREVTWKIHVTRHFFQAGDRQGGKKQKKGYRGVELFLKYNHKQRRKLM